MKNEIKAVEFYEFIDLDLHNQPERSKREDELIKEIPHCKHTRIYSMFDKTEKTNFDDLNDDSDESLAKFIKTLSNYKEVSYWDLPSDHRKHIDEASKEYGSMRCSGHCGNTMREVQ